MLPTRRKLRRPDRYNIPLFSLLTDFGLADGFVGQMKAVILGIAPDARIIDLSHDVPAQDIRAGSLLLERSLDAFGPGVIHVCVVDPGVGSFRLPIAVRTRTATLVGPDNGLLSPALGADGVEVRAIEHPLLRRPSVTATFHGRDLFSVAAARIGMGFPFTRVGCRVETPVRLPALLPTRSGSVLRGEVIATDHFGNAETNILAPDLNGFGVSFVFCNNVPYGPVRGFYAEVQPGEPLALINSAGRLELAVNCRRAADLGAWVGLVVEVRPDES